VAPLTMAAVALRLGSHPWMALYRHVPSKDALIDLMLDRVTGEVALPAQQAADWRSELWAIARSSWRMVRRHTWYAQLVHTRPPLGPNMLRRTERILTILTGEGATDAEAMTYAALLDRHVFGGALQAAGERDLRTRYALWSPAEEAAAIDSARALVASDEYPILSRWTASPTITWPDDEFELSLGFLLDGIAARLGSTMAEFPHGKS